MEEHLDANVAGSAKVENYLAQLERWPATGHHIMAHFDADSIVVYQAYKPSIAAFAVKHQRFGGGFSIDRMSWIKPNFLWMMYRSGWAQKADQERILAVRLSRRLFDDLLHSAVSSSYDQKRFATHDAWKEAVRSSDVRLQWDPDHDPNGRPLERRAVQLGLRGAALGRYVEEALSITDIPDFVAMQRAHLDGDLGSLVMPHEQVYRPNDDAAAVIGIDPL